MRLRHLTAPRCAPAAALIAAAALLDTAPAFAQMTASGAVVQTDQVRAELLAHAPDGVVPGAPVLLGLKLEHKPEWHTYWVNPGDSGLPTTLAWTLPAGFGAGDIMWPTPKKLPVGPMVNYGYDGTLLLPVKVDVPASFAAATLQVKLEAQWLVCKDVCIPEQGSFALDIPARAATGVNGALFEAARRALPVAADGGLAGKAAIGANGLNVELRGMPAAWHGKPVEFFAELAGVIDHAAKVTGQWQGATWTATVPLSSERTESPASLVAVLATPGQGAGLRVSLDVTGIWPSLPGSPAAASAGAAGTVAAAAATTSAAGALDPSRPAPAASPPSMTLWLALLSALVGGLLLNLMPCVLPVLSLKALGLSKHHDRAARVGSGVAYTAGVLMSFIALAAALLALRGAGEAIGWGFQLQSPPVVAALAALFTLIGLNLAGVFEFGASVVPGALAAAQPKHPWVDAWLTGVLAVAVAAPCTAPFMGAALGYAVGLPTMQALLIFAMLGLGLALPFLLLALSPRLARWLPKPGAWMARFKVAMAFPMFATVVWLVWVLGQQSGIDAAAALLAVLVALAFAAWAWGARAQGMGRVWAAAGAALTAVVVAWAWPMWREAREAPAATAAAGWEPWTPARVESHRRAGRIVFVDFTAAWCVSCQVNKRTTLDTAEVRRAFEQHKVALLRADWTRRDATIAAELERLGRNGVPVYALYRPGTAAPVLLPELLTRSIVIDALAVAAQPDRTAQAR